MKYRVKPESYEDKCKRFWSKVDIKSDDECWNWIATVNASGRGSFSDGKYRVVQAHRVAYQLHFGTDISGVDVLHKCDNPLCCNPKHLFVGSHQDNMHDMSKKGRSKTPRPGNGYIKIAKTEHPNIIKMFNEGASQKQIAKSYNCTAPNIRYILKKYGYKPKNRKSGSD